MAGEQPYYILKIETRDPPELQDFVASLTGIGNQFDRYIQEHHPDLSGTARFYVQEVRKGSLVIEILPFLQPIIERMDQFLIVKDFAVHWQTALSVYLDGVVNPKASKSEMKDFLDTVKVVAKDRRASQRLSIAAYEDGKRKVRTVFKFETPEARKAQAALENQIDRLNAVSTHLHRKVVMHYRRMDSGPASIGKGSGERVVVEQLSARPMPVIYQSEIAQERIKDLLTHHEYPWQLNFIVDVFVVTKGGLPSSYAVTNFYEFYEDDEPAA